MASSKNKTRLGSLIFANLLIPVAVLVFATGFFPYKPFLSGLATFKEVETEEQGLGLLHKDARPERVFDKVIFMVVDALRSDFVYGHGSGFVFTQSLIRTGAAVPLTAHAAPPTVTMPRVKGLTSGSVPSFLDLILNFAESDTSSSLATQDTWLAQIKAHLRSTDGEQGKLVFYGDDTWLKLFPDFFARTDGTSSFFVSDFTEVDNNVTRHVPDELHQPDWNAMILHYLGLDHIGHKSGPLSPNMLPKQQEMDAIVENIYEAMNTLSHLENTLLVLAGDHGMNSAGNHGGSAEGETSPALVFISPKLREITCDADLTIHSEPEESHPDSMQPRRPASAATFFAIEQKQKLSGVNAAASHDELTKYLTQIWDSMSPTEKAVYERLAFQDKMRYEEDRAKAYCKTPLPYKAPAEPRAGTEFGYYHRVEQSDLVPTLAALLGVPVSRNNLGIIVPEFLKFWQNDKVERGLRSDQQLLYRNALQMLRILKAAYGDDLFNSKIEDKGTVDLVQDIETCREMPEGADQLSCKWRLVKYSLFHEDGEYSDLLKTSILTDFVTTTQDTLSTTASSYNVPRLVAGVAIALIATVAAVFSRNKLLPPTTTGITFTAIIALYSVMMFATSYVEEEQHFWYWITGAWLLHLYFTRPTRPHTPVSSTLTNDKISTVHDSSSSSSSSNRIAAQATFILLATHRLTTRWNQTGQKHAGAEDVAHHFFPAHHIILWLLVLATYLHLVYRFARRTFLHLASSPLAFMTALSLTAPSLVFKLNFTQADAPELVQGLARQFRDFTAQWDLVTQARATFVGLGVAACALVLLVWVRERWVVGGDDAKGASLPQRLHDLLTLFLITQTRVQNIPVFLLLELQLQSLYTLLSPPPPLSSSSPSESSIRNDPSTSSAITPNTPFQPTQAPAHQDQPILKATVSILLLTHTSYFAFGGSNAISSLDLGNAYNGISGYNVLAVGILLFMSNWAGPIWWGGAGILLLLRLRDGEDDVKPTQAEKANKAQAQQVKRAWVEQEREELKKQALPAGGLPQAKNPQGIWAAHVATLTIFVCAGLVAVMAACTVLRTHLFIWTVFSPKYLYAMAWALGWHFGVNVLLGGLLYWLG